MKKLIPALILLSPAFAFGQDLDFTLETLKPTPAPAAGTAR